MAKSTPHKLAYQKTRNAKPSEVEKRVDQNRARRHAIADGKARVGDGTNVAHKVPLSRGGSDKDANTVVQSEAKNKGWRKGQSGYRVPTVK